VHARRLILLLLLFALVLQATACAVPADWLDHLAGQLRAFGNGKANTGTLSAYQLVQKIADAIADENDVQSAFADIPARQQDGVTLDQFQQYIRFLRRGIPGTAGSFAQMSLEELEPIQNTILERLPDQQTLVDNLRGFWLYYQESGRPSDRFALFIADVPGQLPCLCGEWVRAILGLSDLSLLYFDAIENQDLEALTVLLQPMDLPETVLELRAARTIQFYRSGVSSKSAEFKITYARIDGIGFEAFGITNPDQTQQISRQFAIINRPGDGYIIDDVIPSVIDPLDLEVYWDDKPLLTLGQVESDEPVQVRSDELESIIGSPELHDDSNCTATASGNQRMHLHYNGLELKAEGTCFRHSRWNGQVTYLLLEGSSLSLGSGIRPGMTLTQLMAHYPYIRETQYTVKGRSGAGAVTAVFHLQFDILVSIELTLG
jgi:hypothetical protein